MYCQLKGAVSTDPNVVKATTAEIARIDIPDPLKPKMSMNMKNVPGVNKIIRQMVVYNDGTEKNILMLVAVGSAVTSENEAQMRDSINQSMQQQGVDKGQREEIQNGQISSKELTIRGKPAKFTVIKGQGVKSHTPRIQVNGIFQGDSGSVVLMLDVDAEKLGPEKIDAMLESIR